MPVIIKDSCNPSCLISMGTAQNLYLRHINTY
jgi:hypothetical protein